MRSPLWSLQAAIYQRLTSSAELMSKVSGVLDATAENQPFPYITVGEDTAVGWESYEGALDGHEVTHTLHVWSRYEGFAECKQLVDLITQALTSSPLDLGNGFRVVATTLDLVQHMRDPDGITRHAVVRFRFKIQEV